ncbi:hypothetical protein B0S90_0715 [Caldicellulosiruptor bescii]|uniref:PIN domain-containing protein n=3 Tax=Caldicellulosiruptor bescii TaxID=31899 RepID=B9MNP2_CALBD|nr:hypothetical protein [Caldicellulosiruptor bescii]ACM59571.1 hypothetical protein Athe_0439 [Caldicellulosiruptor bescii DSM 6725]PBD04650.1 hypothetical protein B0S85_2329 [Caldicellulosiruptor bescii]PBD05718.1 hypothetical protein B0S90_0715 [Caldicellulosiruptor bescii]PFH15767.1 hypothetical protein B0S88_2272 [Caldicellulosiruptor bescii]PFH17563.1 hypothetical protein B0S93_1423 [Caldicellulosiruptor bescii]
MWINIEEKVRKLLLIMFKKIDIVSVLKSDIIKSLKSGYKDLEDALQIFCSKRVHADYFVTRDEGIQSVDIKIITPKEFIHIFSA